jgi:exosortase/archaeosortase family protein
MQFEEAERVRAVDVYTTPTKSGAAGAMLVAVGRLSLARAFVAAGVAAVLLVAVNQLRLAVIVASMRLWGYQAGYERSHVLIGSAVTTLGLVAVALLFMLLLGPGRRPRTAGNE